MLKRLATLSSARVLMIAAAWPFLLIIVVALAIVIDVARATRARGLIAIGVNVSWGLLALLLLPPLAFIGIAAVARRGSARR